MFDGFIIIIDIAMRSNNIHFQKLHFLNRRGRKLYLKKKHLPFTISNAIKHSIERKKKKTEEKINNAAFCLLNNATALQTIESSHLVSHSFSQLFNATE